MGKDKNIKLPLKTESRNFFGVKQKEDRINSVKNTITFIICLLLSIVLLAAIVLSFKQIPGILKEIITDGEVGIRHLLEYVADIIIVYELILVVNLKNLDSVVEILMIAFTRELVIKEMSVVQLAIGVLCIGGLFAIDKWLVHKDDDELDQG